MELDFTELKAPLVFRKTPEMTYTDLCASRSGNRIELYFKAAAGDGETVLSSWTEDMIRWSTPEKAEWPGKEEAVACGHIIAEEAEGLVAYSPEDHTRTPLDLDSERVGGKGAKPASPSAVSFGNFTYLFYIIGGSIAVAATADGVNYISFLRDEPTYPENGTIYEGDYYRPLPFHEYIKPEPVPSGDNVFDVRSFGAVPSMTFISTPAFRAALEKAAKCRGTVVVDGGYYCVSTLTIPSGVTLFIAYGSAIVASRDLSRYRNMMIGCIDAEDVTIRGGGKIIGNGEYFVHLPLRRPRLKPLDYFRLPPIPYDPMGYPVDSARYAYRSRIRYAFDPYGNGGEEVERPLNNVWIRGSRNVLIENPTESHQSVKDSTAALLTSAMQSVVEEGSGSAAALDNMPVAGKTGTADSDKDIWFCGFTPYYTCAVWGGYDDPKSMTNIDTTFRFRIWKSIMSRIHASLETKQFEMPTSVEQKTICTVTGQLARPGCPSRTEFFASDNSPTETCPGHGSTGSTDDTGTDTTTDGSTSDTSGGSTTTTTPGGGGDTTPTPDPGAGGGGGGGETTNPDPGTGGGGGGETTNPDPGTGGGGGGETTG